MNTEYQLADTLQDTLQNQSSRAVHHTVHLNEANTAAILSEWGLSNDECVLTNFLNETTADIEDRLLYVSFVNDQIVYGDFWFNTDAQLTTDNILLY